MVKRHLKLRYVRYVDDMVMVHSDPKVLLAATDAIRAHLAGLGLRLAESKTFVAPVEKGVDFVGHVIRPHRRSARPKTHRVALARISTMPKAAVPDSATSYLGLFRHSGSRAQISAIGRVAVRRGFRVDRDLTKITIKPRRGAMSSRNPMLAKVHIAKKELGLDDETYRDILVRVTGKSSSAGLSDRQLDAVLAEFKRLGWKPKKSAAPHRPASAKPHVRKVFAIWEDICRQGIPVIANRAGLSAFVQRMTKTEQRPAGLSDPEWLSPAEANRVIEGLKAWRARELAKRGRQ